MQAASIEARRTLPLQEGALTEQTRLRRLDNDETRQIQEKVIREEVEVILTSKDKLTQDEERAFAQGVNKTVTTIKTHREVPAEHKQRDFIQWMMTLNVWECVPLSHAIATHTHTQTDYIVCSKA